MLSYDFKLGMSFYSLDKGYRGYMGIVSMAYYEFKLEMNFDGGYRGYMTVASVVILYCYAMDMCNHIEWPTTFLACGLCKFV